MNTGIESEAEQFDWLPSEAGQAQRQAGGAVLHNCFILNTPG
jgi:hypothetical protein